MLIQTIIIVLAVMCLIHLFDGYGAITGCTCVLLIMATALRGCYHFHGTQCVALLCLMASHSVAGLLVVEKGAFRERGLAYRTCIVLMVLMVSSVYVSGVGKFAELSMADGENEYAEEIARITGRDEKVWNCTLSNDWFMQADRLGLYNIGGVPWFWEAHGARVLGGFGDEPPRVLLLNREHVVWGYSIGDYGGELLSYVDLHYKRYGESYLYIRNDYYDEAVGSLGSGI